MNAANDRVEEQPYGWVIVAVATICMALGFGANGSVSAAAQALKIPVRTLTHKMQTLGIKKRFDT